MTQIALFSTHIFDNIHNYSEIVFTSTANLSTSWNFFRSNTDALSVAVGYGSSSPVGSRGKGRCRAAYFSFASLSKRGVGNSVNVSNGSTSLSSVLSSWATPTCTADGCSYKRNSELKLHDWRWSFFRNENSSPNTSEHTRLPLSANVIAPCISVCEVRVNQSNCV